MSTSVSVVIQSALSVSIVGLAGITTCSAPAVVAVDAAASTAVDRSAKSSRPSVGGVGGTPHRPNSTLIAAVQSSDVGLASGRVAVQSITTQPLCVEAGSADSADETRRRRGPFTAYAAPLSKSKRPTRAPSPVRQRNHPPDRHTPHHCYHSRKPAKRVPPRPEITFRCFAGRGRTPTERAPQPNIDPYTCVGDTALNTSPAAYETNLSVIVRSPSLLFARRTHTADDSVHGRTAIGQRLQQPPAGGLL